MPPDPRRPARRLSLPGLLAAVALLAIALTARADTGPVLTVGFTVADLDRSVAFFTEVLDFEKESEVELAGDGPERLQGVFGLRIRVATLRLGTERIELTEYLAPAGRPVPADSRSHDRWFQHIAIITTDMQAAYARLRAAGVRHASPGPQRLPDWNPAAGGIEAFYFKDPDGHVLEILAFPPGKGHPRWHDPPPGALFLGIDHTAIVVADTERSLRFYRDRLGMTVAGASENHGIEQERLNSVFGARLRITTLRFPGEAWNGPAVELLEYLAPGDARPYPADSRASDLWHWQTTIASSALDSADLVRWRADSTLVSPGPVRLPDRRAGFSRGLLLRDPDGHAVRLVD